MLEKYAEIYDAYTDLSKYNNILGLVNDHPTKDNVKHHLITLKNMIKGNLTKTKPIWDLVQQKKYQTIAMADIKEFSQYEKMLNESDISEKILKKSFSQISVLADNIGLDYSDLYLKSSVIQQNIKNILMNVIKEIDYVKSVITLSTYLLRYENTAKQAIYQEMLDELNTEYSNLTNVAAFTKKDHDDDVTLRTDDLMNRINNEIIKFDLIIDEFIERLYAKNFTEIAPLNERYVRKINTIKDHEELALFLVKKEFETSIKVNIVLGDNQKIQSYTLMNDNSVFIKKNDTYQAIRKSNELTPIMKEFQESAFSHLLRKKPTMAKIFIEVLKDSQIVEFNKGLTAINTYLENEQILKNMKFNHAIFKEKDFEGIDDYMHSLINEHKIMQYAKSILSNKNKEYLSKDALTSFKLLKEMDITEHQLQDLIGKKLSALKSTEDFEAYLKKVVAHFSGFNHEVLSQKLLIHKIKSVYDEKNIVVFPVDKYEQSKSLGSPSWCIVRDKIYFDRYTSDDKKQYFIYDFNKAEKDNESMIGFTLEKNGTFNTQHAKNDDYYKVNEFLEDIADKIIYENQQDFDLSPDKLEKLNEKFAVKVTSNKNKRVI